MSENFTTPTISINGTSSESLYDELSESRKHIGRAVISLERVTVHPRDFQTMPAGTWVQAQTEHHEAVNRLGDALDWVDAWLIAIEEQMLSN